MKDYFSYCDGVGIVPQGAFRISPSQFSKFFDSTSQWFSEQVYKEDAEFQGSTASELGNCVHAAAEMYFDSNSIDEAAVKAHINSLAGSDIDTNEISQQWYIMASTLITNWLSANKGTNAEEFVCAEVLPGIVAAGSIDMYDSRKGIIYDYKTTSQKKAPSSFPRAYWFQQMCYAWILKQKGININRLCLVYITKAEVNRVSEKTGKALKDYPSLVEPLYHNISQNDWDIIDASLKLCADTIKLWQDNPEYRHILAQDMRRKEKAKPIVFKK